MYLTDRHNVGLEPMWEDPGSDEYLHNDTVVCDPGADEYLHTDTVVCERHRSVVMPVDVLGSSSS